MLFVGVLKQKESSPSTELITRRAQYNYPEHYNVLGEYWLQTNDPALPAVISIFETEDVGAIMETFAAWDDAYDITVVPAISAEEGLQLAQQMMEQQGG